MAAFRVIATAALQGSNRLTPSAPVPTSTPNDLVVADPPDAEGGFGRAGLLSLVVCSGLIVSVTVASAALVSAALNTGSSTCSMSAFSSEMPRSWPDVSVALLSRVRFLRVCVSERAALIQV